MRVLLPIVLASLLAACETGPRVVEQSNPSITYRYDGNDVTQARQQADRYCGDFGRQAQLVDTSRRGGANLATFECR